jgi:GT2 family glycosyltransferase
VSTRPVRVSFVLLAWNHPELEALAIASVLAQTDPHWQLLVVDNGSSPALTLPSPAQADARVSLLRSESNLGFAAGMNLGLRVADGELLVPLNGDVVLREDYVAELRRRYDQCVAEHIGALAPLVYRGTPEEPRGIESKGWYLRGRFSVISDPEMTDGSEAFGGSGACGAYLAEAVRAVSPHEVFDSSYYAYGEDIDLHFRLHYAGWSCRYVESLVGWHRVSAYFGTSGSALAAPANLQPYILGNRVRNIIKYLSARDLLWFGPPIFITEVGLLLSSLFLRRPPFAAYRRAYRAVWAERGKLLAQRREVQRARTMSSRALRALVRGI